MRKVKRDNSTEVRTSIRGIAYVVVCIAALLFFMEGIVVVVRFVVG